MPFSQEKEETEEGFVKDHHETPRSCCGDKNWPRDVMGERMENHRLLVGCRDEIKTYYGS